MACVWQSAWQQVQLARVYATPEVQLQNCSMHTHAVGGGPKLVLGIETSCDDTGAAVVTSDGRVLGEAIATQAEIHAQWGEP